jgi:hypothetical protein
MNNAVQTNWKNSLCEEERILAEESNSQDHCSRKENG